MRRQLLVGSALRTILAEGLFMPTGLLAMAYLARRLGPADYALFAVASLLIAPLTWAVTMRGTMAIKQLPATQVAWRTVGGRLLWRQFLIGLGGAGLVWVLAPWVAFVCHLPALVQLLRLFALELPLAALAGVHRDLLIVRGDERWRTSGNLARMLARPLLIVLFVEAGLGVTGAIIGTLGVSVIHLAISGWANRRGLRSAPWSVSARPQHGSECAFLSGIVARINERLDLLLLAVLGGFSTTELGYYASAQFLTGLPVVIALAAVGSLQSALVAELHEGRRQLARQLLRGVLLVWPGAALAAGSAPQVLRFLFGEVYVAAGGALTLLIVAAALVIWNIVAQAILQAGGWGKLVLALHCGQLIIAPIMMSWLAPMFGMVGVATAQLGATVLQGVISQYFLWQLLHCPGRP